MENDSSHLSVGGDSVHDRETAVTPTPDPMPTPAFDPTLLSAVDSGDSLLGVMIRNYHIEGLLGKGGFGAVYQARDVKLDRNVALKFLKNPLAEEHRALFEREAKAIAALSKHPSIVQIYDWDEVDKYVYFVLEFVPNSVDRLLEKNPSGLTIRRALEIALAAAEALAYAHAEGFIHRDIKPANILIDEKAGQVKLADFGLVSVLRSDEQSILAGRISGSPLYMSPEQASGWPLDARTDIYSLGVTLYRLLSGKLPIDADNQSEALRRVRDNERTPLSSIRPDLPAAVLELVEKSTAHDAGERYQTAQAFAEAIARVLQGEAASIAEDERVRAEKEVETIREPLPRRRHLILRVAVALLLASGAVLTWQLLPSTGSDPGGRDGYVQAVAQLDRGEYPQAAQRLRDLPQTDEVRHALVYALLFQSHFDEAAEIAAAMADAGLRNEVLAALAVERGDEGARAKVDALGSAYAGVLLARLDFLDGNHAAAIDLLKDAAADDLAFDWQYDQASALLGQAYFKTGQYDAARDAFQRIGGKDTGASSPAMASVADGYLHLIERRMDTELQESNLERAKELGERIRSGEIPVATRYDLWTSRPLRFIVLPTDSGKSRYARESGLDDFLSDLLGVELDAHPRFEWVDRDDLDVALAEQTLSSYLSSDADRLRLGQFLGAKLIVEGKFLTLMGEDSLGGKIVDSETTGRIPAQEIPVAGRMDPRAVVAQYAVGLVDRIEKEYPLRARLLQEDATYYLDIGSAVGLEPGARFDLLSTADASAKPLNAVVAIVDEIVSAERARAHIEGDAQALEPFVANGLYAVATRTVNGT